MTIKHQHYSSLSRAKHNLTLRVGEKSPTTGRHVLESIFFPLSLSDKIELEINRETPPSNNGHLYSTEVILSSGNSIELLLDLSLGGELERQSVVLNNGSFILNTLANDSNLVIRAIKAFYLKAKELDLPALELPRSIYINLIKFIPLQSGLGGGSSNAATIIKLLCKHYSLDSSFGAEVALECGDDALPCYYVSPLLLTKAGINLFQGDEADSKDRSYPVIILKPEKGSCTRSAFEALNRPILSLKKESSSCELDGIDRDTLNAIRSVSEIFNLKLKNIIIENNTIDPYSFFFNDFEESVFIQLPELGLARDLLLNSGASQVLLSGSGSSIIAYFMSEKRADEVLREIRACLGDTWFIEKSFLCKDMFF